MIKPLRFALLVSAGLFTQQADAQTIDTLAFQDFEITPTTSLPVWSFTGPVIYNSGFSSATTAAPTSSPIGIGGSRAWETTTNSGGLVLEFANITIPAGYDTVRMHFNLAAMNLISTGGGPDNLDYVLVQYSTDGGATYTSRMRIRGATTDNSYWAYNATGVASVYSTPAIEQVFQPTSSGLQVAEGYSFCEIYFDASVITQLRVRITARSSSSTDTWLVDNVTLTAERSCSATSAVINPSSCGAYTSPAGNVYASSGTYTDTLTNSTGCDSIITINLDVTDVNTTVTPGGSVSLTAAPGADAYQWLNCTTMMPLSGETSPGITFGMDGSYAVIVTQGTCTDTSLCYTILGTGLAENELMQNLGVYPNPTTGNISLQLNNVQQSINVQLFNIAGKMVQQQQYNNTGFINMYIDAVPGVYYMRISNAAGQYAMVNIIKQ